MPTISEFDWDDRNSTRKPNSSSFRNSYNSSVHSHLPVKAKYMYRAPTIYALSPTTTQETQTPQEIAHKQGKLLTWLSWQTKCGSDPHFQIDFNPGGDPRNPISWSAWRKSKVVIVAALAELSVHFYATVYISGIVGMQDVFQSKSQEILLLGLTIFMIGIALGSVLLTPLSDIWGRKPIMIIGIGALIGVTVPCGITKNFGITLVCRFFGGIFGSLVLANASEMINDVVTDQQRTIAMCFFSIFSANGPVAGPIVGGWIFEQMGWRWTNWLPLMLAFATLGCLVLLPETYKPAILRSMASERRSDTGDRRFWSSQDETKSLKDIFNMYIARPIKMSVTEPICIFWNFCIAVVSALLYTSFVTYPIVFNELRGWSLQITGLSFLGILTGSILAIFMEPFFRIIINNHKKNPSTAKIEPEAFISIALIGSIIAPLGQMIFAWTSAPSTIPWYASLIASVLFGMGTTMVLMYGQKYLIECYKSHATSALVGNNFSRYVLCGSLPIAGPAVYKNVGANYGGLILSLLGAIMIPIPLVFYYYGNVVRRSSSLIQRLQNE